MNTARSRSCTAGFARLDITPPLGAGIGGGWDFPVATCIHDPLFVNAVAFGCEDKSAVLLVCDLLGLYGEYGQNWPVQIARELGLEPGSVFVCCTHTHASPLVNRHKETPPGEGGSDAQYNAWLYRRLRDAGRMALDDRKSVTDIQWAQGETRGVAFVRRYFMTDGTVMTNPAHLRPDIDRPANETDESMRLIRILRQDAKEITLINYQLHPTHVRGSQGIISADFPGVLRTRMEQDRDLHCVFINGAEGQMISADRRQPKPEADGYAWATEIADKLAELALDLYPRTKSTGMIGLSFARETVSLRTKYDPAKRPEYERIVRAYLEGHFEDIHPTRKQANYLYSESSQLCQLGEGSRVFMDVPFNVLAFCGLALAGFPGEPFNEVGKYLRANAPFPVTCVCCQTNDAAAYFPMERDVELGGYERYCSPLAKGTTEQLMHRVLELLKTL